MAIDQCMCTEPPPTGKRRARMELAQEQGTPLTNDATAGAKEEARRDISTRHADPPRQDIDKVYC